MSLMRQAIRYSFSACRKKLASNPTSTSSAIIACETRRLVLVESFPGGIFMNASGAWCAGAILAACLLGITPGAFAQFPPQTPPAHKPHPPATPESIVEGKQLFQGTCANCHGIDGSGANGPNIQNAAVTMGPEGLYTRMTSGPIGTAMPNFTFLGDDKIWAIADYVATLGPHGAALQLGDAQKGKQVYE